LGKGDWSVLVGDSANDSVVESAVEFRLFVESFDRQLWRSLVPSFGVEVANDATADAFAYAWQHWDRVRAMENPRGYLYRVARSCALPRRKPDPVLPAVDPSRLPEYEPGLVPALAELTEMQRTVVYLVEGCQWGLTEVAELLGISVSTVRNHLSRGMDRLRARLEVRVDV
jgi:DNA-directed RNA polymerase specialized sigma24 family protein